MVAHFRFCLDGRVQLDVSEAYHHHTYTSLRLVRKVGLFCFGSCYISFLLRLWGLKKFLVGLYCCLKKVGEREVGLERWTWGDCMEERNLGI
jgi:hypothetical protein